MSYTVPIRRVLAVKGAGLTVGIWGTDSLGLLLSSSYVSTLRAVESDQATYIAARTTYVSDVVSGRLQLFLASIGSYRSDSAYSRNLDGLSYDLIVVDGAGYRIECVRRVIDQGLLKQDGVLMLDDCPWNGGPDGPTDAPGYSDTPDPAGGRGFRGYFQALQQDHLVTLDYVISEEHQVALLARSEAPLHQVVDGMPWRLTWKREVQQRGKLEDQTWASP